MGKPKNIGFRCIDCKYFDYEGKVCTLRNYKQFGGTPMCKNFEVADVGDRLFRRYKYVNSIIERTFNCRGKGPFYLTVEFEGRIYVFEPLNYGVRILDITDDEEKIVGVYK